MKRTWRTRAVSLGLTAALCMGLAVMPAGAADATPAQLTGLTLSDANGALTLYQTGGDTEGFSAEIGAYTVYVPAVDAPELTVHAAADTAVTAQKGETPVEAEADSTYDFKWTPAADETFTLAVAAAEDGTTTASEYTITAAVIGTVAMTGLSVKAGETELITTFASETKAYAIEGLKLAELTTGLTITPTVDTQGAPVRWALNGGAATEASDAFTVLNLKNGDVITVIPGDGKKTTGETYTLTVAGEEDLKLADLSNPVKDGPQLLQADRDTSKPLASQRFASDRYNYTLRVLPGQSVELDALYPKEDAVIQWSEVKAEAEDAAKVTIGAPDTSAKYHSQVTLKLAEGATSAKIAVQVGDNGKPYYVTLTPATDTPNVTVKLDSSLGTVGKASVTARNMDITTLRFSVQMDAASDVISGFADASGTPLYDAYTGCASVNVLKNVGYDSGNKQVTLKDETKPAIGQAADGWTPYTLGGKTIFSYNSNLVSGDPVLTYYPGTGTLTVSLSVEGTDTGVTELTCDGDGVELFRFYYGLKSGKDSGDLEDAITTADVGKAPVRVGALNSITEIRLGTVTPTELPDLVEIKVAPLCAVTVLLNVTDEALAAEKFTYDLLPAEKVKDEEKVEDGALTQDSLTVRLTKGDYTLLIKGDGYLIRSVKLTLSDDVAETTRLVMKDMVRTYAGKLEESAPHAITLLDRSALYSHLDEPLITNKNSKYNLNDDNALDVLDLAVLLENLGMTSENYKNGKYDYTMTVDGGPAA